VNKINGIFLVLAMFCIGEKGFSESVPKPLLVCRAIGFDDIYRIEVLQTPRGEFFRLEYSADGKVGDILKLEASSLAKKEYVLSNWFNYKRVLRLEDEEWIVEYKDECSWGIHWVQCE